MKIVGFSQLRNELRNGNLENWFKCMNTICDFIYIFDQNSDDGSVEYYKKFENTIVIESKINRFKEELLCKDELLNLIKKEQPDTNFIQWLDGDELLDGRLLKNNGDLFKSLCHTLLLDDCDGYLYGHKNLWRSDTYERIDSDYNWLDNNGLCKLWKFSPNISFQRILGLHQGRYYPLNINKLKRIDYNLIHRGFSTDNQILSKFEMYKSMGQNGNDLYRLVDECNLITKRIDILTIPDWFNITDDVNPIYKEKLINIYNERCI